MFFVRLNVGENFGDSAGRPRIPATGRTVAVRASLDIVLLLLLAPTFLLTRPRADAS